MRPEECAARPSAWASLAGGLASYIRKTLVISEQEARKLRHDPSELFSRAVQPALWLLVFGQVFGSALGQARALAMPPGVRYQDFIAPGILAQSVLFIAIFYGITIIWERDLGVVHKFLVSPTPRSALVLGKALSAGLRALSQVVVIYVLALIVGVKLNFMPLPLLGVMLVTVLGAAIFSTFSLVIACLVKTRERFMGIGQLMTMPLFFASNAIYPIALMPTWLKIVSRINPLTYQVDALRGLMLAGGTFQIGLALDLAVLLFAVVLLISIGAKLYPTVVI